MIRTKSLALVVAVVAAFIASSLWYSPLLFGREWVELSCPGVTTSPVPSKIALELIRSFVLAYVIARLVAAQKVIGLKSALGLGALLWLGFPVLLLSGSVMWQNVPLTLALIHAGDWLLKIFLMTVIVSAMGQGRSVDTLVQRPA
jgi:hypothetical protein